MGSTRPIEGYIFDLGNVIVDIHVDRFLPALGLDGRWSIEEALGKYEDSGLSRDFELGLLSFDEFYGRSCELFGIDPDRERFLTAWNAIIGDEKAGMYEIVKSCAGKAPVYLLSNTNDPHYRYSLQRASSLHLMKEHFLSYKLKVLKPDPGIYIKTIERIGIPADRLFFTDDLEDNIASALQVGLRAVQFTGTAQLENALRNL